MKAAPAIGELKRKVALRAVASIRWGPSWIVGKGDSCGWGAGGRAGSLHAQPSGGAFSCTEMLNPPIGGVGNGSPGPSMWEPSTAIRYSLPALTGALSEEYQPGEEEASGTSAANPDPS